MKVLDTTFLIDLIRGKKEKTLAISKSKEILLTTQINIYEIIRGLFLKNVSPSKFLEITETLNEIGVLSLDDNGIIKSAEISAQLMKNGQTISDCDCLTAGIALSKGVDTIITRNAKHFKRIKGLKVETY